MRLGLLSNAGDSQNVQRLVDQAGFRQAFDPIIVSAEIGLRKPHARAFEPILEQWRVHPSEVVMIGDTLGEDILGAQRCGMHQIWVHAFSDARSTAAFSGNREARGSRRGSFAGPRPDRALEWPLGRRDGLDGILRLPSLRLTKPHIPAQAPARLRSR